MLPIDLDKEKIARLLGIQLRNLPLEGIRKGGIKHVLKKTY